MNYLRILLIAMTINLIGCYTENKAVNSLNKAYSTYPDAVAQYTRDHFPCEEGIPSVKYDTLYDFVEIQCPEVNQNSQVTDTIYLTKFLHKIDKAKPSRFIAVPIVKEAKTIKVKDQAELEVSEFRLEQCESEKSNYIEKVVNRGNWIKWLLILLMCSLFGNLYQMRK